MSGNAVEVAHGIHLIRLPVPFEGLSSVNVYAIEGDDGLTMIDGGWASDEALDELGSAVAGLGYDLGDIRRFLVTHVHGDHYSLASRIASVTGAQTYLGAGERDSLHGIASTDIDEHMRDALRAAGAPQLADSWTPHELGTPDYWHDPTTWLDDGHHFDLGSRRIDVLATPGHTHGHVIYVDPDARFAFTGDHVLPRITPSVGFEAAIQTNPLRDYLASLERLAHLPDARLFPAHGDPADSMHARIRQLLEHHDRRLRTTFAALKALGPATPYDIARAIPWTRRERAFDELGSNDAALAAMETRAHLEVLCDRIQVKRCEAEPSDVYAVRTPLG